MIECAGKSDIIAPAKPNENANQIASNLTTDFLSTFLSKFIGRLTLLNRNKSRP